MDSERYHDKIRLRICGLLIKDNSILLARIKSPVLNNLIWMPPGGGLEFGESINEGLEREFKEETNLEIEVGSLQFVNELVKPPFHAVELYYIVEEVGGSMQAGTDPEHSKDKQLIDDLKWFTIDSLTKYEVHPPKLLHYFGLQP